MYLKLSKESSLYLVFYNEQPLRERHRMCFTIVSPKKGMFRHRTECVLSCLNITAQSYCVFSLPLKKNLLNPKESSRQVQFPLPQLYDTEMVTFTPELSSSIPQVKRFLFLDYCVASRQSLHVFPWKPFCLLSIFLHYLPVPSAFQYVFFCLPLFISFSPTLIPSISALPWWGTSPLPCSW